MKNRPATFNSSTPIFDRVNETFGRMVPAMERAFLETQVAMERFNETFREYRSRVKYATAIDEQRAIGLAFVKAEAARVRRELGLDG